MKQYNWLKEDESGQGVVEYALILSGIALIVAVAVLAMGPQIRNFFTSFGEQITNP